MAPPFLHPRRIFYLAVHAAALLLALVFIVVLYRHVMDLKPPSPVFLSDLKPGSVSQDWGELGLDQSVLSNPLTLGTAWHPKGLGTHANSRLCHMLDGKYRTFAAGIGPDSETAHWAGKMVFRVVGDDRVLYENPVLSGVREPVTIQVDVTGVKGLCLIVLDGGDGINSDHADWGGPG